MNPLVTLITPVYNAMPYFKDFIESVENQSYRPMQFIIVDDGSTDDSYDYLLQNKNRIENSKIDLKIIKNEHENQSAAVNSALKYVSGEFITWCDADDVMTYDNIEKKVKYLLEHNDIDIVRNDGLLIDESNKEKRRRSSFENDRFTKNIFEDLITDITYCYSGCYMIRTSKFFECYPKREIPISPCGQNLQLLLPVASRSKCGFIDEILHYYTRRKNGHSSKENGYNGQLKRIKDFTKLKKEILNYCECDKKKYEKLIDDLEEKNKQRLLSELIIKARRNLKK